MDVVSTTPFPCENSTREEEVSYFDPSAKYVSQSALYNCLVAAIFGLLSVGAVLGNSAAIFLLIRTRDTFLTGNAGKLLVNLALADLVTGCFSTPFRFQMVLFQHWAYGASFCSFSCFVDNWSLFSSVYTLLMIALDRYVAVVTPFSMLFKRVSLKWWIALIWLLSILSAAPATLITRTTDIRNPCDYEDVFRTLCYVDLRYQQAVDMFTLITSYVLPLVLMIMFYAAITRRLIQSSRVVSNTTVLGQTHSARNQKVVRVLVAVVCIFLLCWLPIRLYQVIKFIYPSILKSPLVPKFYLAAYWLGVSNSTWNPIIYSFYFSKTSEIEVEETASGV
ncbi:tachykinin-like peptides receptor 99D [Convolutriloba macropyga]|uniref:tachykinin-like peptides receptor 99D n=1 Tax=Convolutriloba macropyga TaxID=536237 RepID=UPI003F528085